MCRRGLNAALPQAQRRVVAALAIFVLLSLLLT
jgi:hypothetical protein